MRTTSTRTDRRGFTLSDAVREFLRHPSPWMIGGRSGGFARGADLVGDWQLDRRVGSARDAGRLPVLRMDRSRLRAALAAKATRSADHRLPAGPQAPRAPRRPARRAADLHSVANAALGAAGRGRDRAASPSPARARADLPGVRRGARPGLRVVPLPDSQRLQAEVTLFRAMWRNHRQHHFRTSTTGSP